MHTESNTRAVTSALERVELISRVSLSLVDSFCRKSYDFVESRLRVHRADVLLFVAMRREANSPDVPSGIFYGIVLGRGLVDVSVTASNAERRMTHL